VNTLLYMEKRPKIWRKWGDDPGLSGGPDIILKALIKGKRVRVRDGSTEVVGVTEEQKCYNVGSESRGRYEPRNVGNL
jgi:hypothetical protein